MGIECRNNTHQFLDPALNQHFEKRVFLNFKLSLSKAPGSIGDILANLGAITQAAQTAVLGSLQLCGRQPPLAAIRALTSFFTTAVGNGLSVEKRIVPLLVSKPLSWSWNAFTVAELIG